jgi:small-conductance mechanosensitive channel/CRP-like cAMP-binding protein
MTPALLLTIPLALASLLALARLARLRPVVRPLLVPWALLVIAAVGLALAGQPPLPGGSLGLLVLVPVLILLVRGGVIAFDLLFRRSQGEAPPPLLDSVVSVLLYGLGAGLIARYWFAVELAPVLATSAVVGAVVGLALQDTLGNLFAGIALHTSSPFAAGDWVRIGSHEGCLEEVSWRAVRLRNWSGDLLTVPNNEVARSSIQNFSQPAALHSRFLVMGVNYQTPPNQVVAVLRRLLTQIPELPSEPEPVVRIVAYKDFTIEYEIRYFLRSYADYRRIEGEIYRLIWYHFRRHGIEIPFPIRNVYLRTPEAAAAQRDERSLRLERTLRAIDLFQPLSEEELQLAASRFRRLHYAAGERLISEGEPGDSFFVIDRGEVEVTRRLPGRQLSLARLSDGQFFGEMALLTGEPRSATVTAATDVDVFSIDKAGFIDVLVKNPEIAVDVSTVLSERREAMTQAAGDVTTRFEGSSRGEIKQHLLGRIRQYFGL